MSTTEKITSPCLEAHRQVTGPRRKTHGPIEPCFELTANLWSLMLSTEVTVQDVCRMMICFKLARDVMVEQNDNLVDICGYTELAHIMRNRKENDNDDSTES